MRKYCKRLLGKCVICVSIYIVSTIICGGAIAGVVLEGVGKNVPRIRSIDFYSTLNAFLINRKIVYFSPVDRVATAAILRSINRDDRMGVSLGGADIIYGALEHRSDVVWSLRLVDLFLADIVYASPRYTFGYLFAEGYKPKRHKGKPLKETVVFSFNGYEFGVKQNRMILVASNFEVTLVPLSARSAAGHLPDYRGIAKGAVSPQKEENARHLGRNITYYAREPLVATVIAYGELAAFARALKRQKVKIPQLIRSIEKTGSENP